MDNGTNATRRHQLLTGAPDLIPTPAYAVKQTMLRLVTWLRGETLFEPDGSVRTCAQPAVWVLAHRGYAGNGRLDLWGYPTREAALAAGVELATEATLAGDPGVAEELEAYLADQDHESVLALYERVNPAGHLLRVEPAWLQEPALMPPARRHEPGTRGASRLSELFFGS